MTYLSHQPGRKTTSLSFEVSQRISDISGRRTEEKSTNIAKNKEEIHNPDESPKKPKEKDDEEMKEIHKIAAQYPGQVKKINYYLRVGAHIACFFILSVLLLWTSKEWAIPMTIPKIFLCCWAILDEVTKMSVAGRHCDLEGITLNLLGVGIGMLIIR